MNNNPSGKSRLKSLALLFRGPFLRRVAKRAHGPIFAELIGYAADDRMPALAEPLSAFFDYFYQRLLEDYRCEYVYKNAIANEIFIARHSEEKNLLTEELTIAGSRVDLAMMNASSTAFEIKTELDSSARLETQLQDYCKVFDEIYVVVPIHLSFRYEKLLNDSIGILALKQDGALETVRESLSHKATAKPSAIFDCMRRAEYVAAVKEAFGSSPAVPNGQVYKECKKMFCRLLPFEAHDLMVRHVRKRHIANARSTLFQEVPRSLKLAALTLSATQTECRSLLQELQQPLNKYEDILSILKGQTERTVCSPRTGETDCIIEGVSDYRTGKD
jgi:hypothetical protein